MSRARRERASEGPAHCYWQGRALLESGDWQGAAAAFARGIAAAPADAALHRAHGLALSRLDRFDEAISSFARAAAASPGMARAHADLGVTLLKVRRAAEAIGPLETALRLDPALAQARICLGLACAHAGQPDRALTILDASVADDPDPAIHAARAWAMLNQGRVAAALDVLDRTLARHPTHEVAHYNRLFALQHQPGITPMGLLVAHRAWAAVAMAKAAGAALPPLPPLPGDGRMPVIGILSGDLRQHAVSQLTLRAFEALARRNVRIHCYANQSDSDNYTQRFRALAWRWHGVEAMDDDAIAALIRRERVGVLFDLSGVTARHRLPVFARRAAPVQISWAGYAGTTGLPTMDGLIADSREIPAGADAAYAETVLRLTQCYVCYDGPATSPMIGPVPQLVAGHPRFGCFHRAAKLNAGVFALWARIAARLPQARFVLRYSCYAQGQTRDAVSLQAERAGLAPAHLVFEPGGDPAGMLAAYNTIDVALDTAPYSGGVTTLEALWMGVPVVTQPGATFAGRHSLSHLQALGLHELIAGSADEYVDGAVALAGDVPALAAYRAGLRDRLCASPLMDAERFADALTAALLGLIGERAAAMRAGM